ncbi:MAG: prevent-host-death protein [Chloroflexota bacterium]|nr:prevent-host-death protein [Chloroflexota bacterium]
MIELEAEVQYISDEQGHMQGVIVPIELWREILSERETAYLLNSEAMKRRLLEAMQRQEGIRFEEALEKPGV